MKIQELIEKLSGIANQYGNDIEVLKHSKDAGSDEIRYLPVNDVALMDKDDLSETLVVIK